MVRSPLPFIDYSARDFESIRSSIFDFLRNKYPNDWTDFSESNLGTAIVEVVAWAFDSLSFAMDRAVNENFITTARDRQSVIRLASLLGYKLAPASAASVELLALDSDLAKLASPILITAGTKLVAGDVVFEIDKDYTIIKTPGVSAWSTNGGSQSSLAIIGARQGETNSATFTGDGTKNQVYKMNRRPYIDKSVYVQVAGIRWSEVQSIILGDPVNQGNQNIYEISLDKDDYLSVKFGDGIAGNMPADGESIQIYQRIGGGDRGNIAAGAVDTSINCVANGAAAKLHVMNYSPASGGADRETTEHAKLYAPVWARTTDRAITLDDYLAICNGFSDGENGRVAKAGIVANPTDGLSNVVTVFAWAEDGQGTLVPCAGPLKDALHAYLSERKVITVYLSPIQDGENVPVDLSMLVSIFPGFDREEIRRQANIVLLNLFRSTRVRYDNELRMSWIHDYMIAVPGVKSVSITSPNPTTIPCTVAEIDPGTLPSQTGAALDQIIITSAVARPANYWVNYNIVLGYNTVTTLIRRVVASSAVINPGDPCTLTLDDATNGAAIAGTAYTFRHYRRVKLTPVSGSITSESLVKNRRLVIRMAEGPIEKSITSFDTVESIAYVDEDFVSIPKGGISASITPDYMTSQLRTLSLGSVDLDIEDAS